MQEIQGGKGPLHHCAVTSSHPKCGSFKPGGRGSVAASLITSSPPPPLKGRCVTVNMASLKNGSYLHKKHYKSKSGAKNVSCEFLMETFGHKPSQQTNDCLCEDGSRCLHALQPHLILANHPPPHTHQSI